MDLNLPKRLRQAWILPLGFVLVGAMGIVSSYIAIESHRKSADVAVARYQRERAEIVAGRVRTFLLTATQIAKSQRVFVEKYQGSDKHVIETYIDHFLESTPDDLIYGTGVWYEPKAFNGHDHYFGPYVHRGESPGSRVLTYEWNDPEYDYPSQHWYQIGMNDDQLPVFSEPYLDRGIVYMTLALGFRNLETGQKRGMISVGMILPQLQSIIEHLNRNGDDTIYLIGRSRQIIAHPRVKDIMAVAEGKANGVGVVQSILDASVEDGFEPIEQPVIHQELIAESGWHVVVVSPYASVYSGFLRFRSFVTDVLVAYLISLAAIFCLIVSFRRRMDAIEEKNFEELRSMREQLASVVDHVQVGILRADRTGGVEKGYTQSSYRILGRVVGEDLTAYRLWDLLDLEGEERSAFIQSFHLIFAEAHLADEHLSQLNRQFKVKSKMVDIRCCPIKKHGQIEALLVLVDSIPAS